MIAACPKCGARYRIEDGRLPPQGARLRCARCEAVFKVIAPARPRAEPERAAAAPGGALVLVADPEPESGRATSAALSAWGLRTLLVHDGVEAILAIQRSLPRAVILDAALPKMFGFQICELMKRNESLRQIGVVLVGAIHDRERYRRPPSELYGADAYVERPGLAEQLHAALRKLGLALAEAPRPAQQQPAPAATRPPEPPPQAREARAQRAAGERSSVEVAPQGRAAAAQRGAAERSLEGLRAQRGEAERSSNKLEVEKAERLARIVVSDIVLYNAEKFEVGIAEGDVLSALSAELQEGRGLFRQRIDAAVLETRDFLAEELLRVARRRGMQ